MINRDKSISVWQTGILTFIMMFTNKILVLPSILSENTKIEAVLIVFLSFLLEIGLLVLFYITKRKFPEKSIFEILKINFGKWISISFAVLCALFFFSKSVFMFNVFEFFLRSVMYKDAVNFLFLVCVLPVVSFVAYSGLRTMARTFQIFFPVIILTTLFCVIVGFFEIDGGLTFNLSQIKDFANNFFSHLSAFGDSLFLFIVMDKLKIKRGEWKVFYTLSSLGMFFVCTICFVYVFSYTYTTFFHPFAIFEMLSFVKEYDGLGRIDIIAVILMMIFFYFQFTIFLKGFLDSLSVTGDFFTKKISILIFNFIFIIISLYFVKNLNNALFLGEKIIPFFEIIPFILLPCLIFSAKKGEK